MATRFSNWKGYFPLKEIVHVAAFTRIHTHTHTRGSIIAGERIMTAIIVNM